MGVNLTPPTNLCSPAFPFFTSPCRFSPGDYRPGAGIQQFAPVMRGADSLRSCRGRGCYVLNLGSRMDLASTLHQQWGLRERSTLIQPSSQSVLRLLHGPAGDAHDGGGFVVTKIEAAEFL